MKGRFQGLLFGIGLIFGLDFYYAEYSCRYSRENAHECSGCPFKWTPRRQVDTLRRLPGPALCLSALLGGCYGQAAVIMDGHQVVQLAEGAQCWRPESPPSYSLPWSGGHACTHLGVLPAASFLEPSHPHPKAQLKPTTPATDESRECGLSTQWTNTQTWKGMKCYNIDEL